MAIDGDPIEYLFTPAKCLFTQREVASDTTTFAEGLRRSLRQSPDVILLGEIRDSESAVTALQAAETGHLVLATLHSSNVLDSLERLSRLFDVAEREGVFQLLSQQLIGILCQKLGACRKAGGRALVVEHFENQAVTRKWIAEGKFRDLADFVAKGDNPHNVTFLHSLVGMIQTEIGSARRPVSRPRPTRANYSGDSAASTRPVFRASTMDEVPDIIEFLALVVERGGSDLHLCAGSAPMVRLHGDLVPASDKILDMETSRDLIYSIFTENQRARFEETWELDFALMIKGLGRFRSNAHYSRGAVEATFRHIPDNIPSLATLGLPPIVQKLCALEQGLVLVTGITGSGKTTTMAAMVDDINSTRSGVIISIEDPIEYVFTNKLCRVKQREIGTDTKSFPEALRHVLRQDPDVILISEMRDLETISATITAAETRATSSLATLHTIDAPKAIDRIVDAFPPEQQSQIIAQLANALQAIIAQRLLPKADGTGRVACTEVMVMNDGIRALLRDRRFQQVLSMIEIGSRDGHDYLRRACLQSLRHAAAPSLMRRRC